MRTDSNAAIYRPDLGQYVRSYIEGTTMGYIGLEIMPICEVPDPGGTYSVIPKEALLSLNDVSRAPRGEYNRGDWKYENGKYSCSEKGWEEPIDDSERKRLDRKNPGLADTIASERAVNFILRAQEKRIADKIFNAVRFTPNPVAIEWNVPATAVPITNVNAAKAAFRLQCGMLPDALVISYTTYEDLKNVDSIVSRLKYTFPGIDLNKLSSQQLATIFDVPRVLVGGSVYNSAKKNKAATIADFWSSEYAALVKISSGPDLTQPGVGRTFLWTEDSPENAIVEQYREEKIRSDVFRVRHSVGEEYICSYTEAGAVVSDIAASCMYLMSNIHT